MLQSIYDDIKDQFSHGNMITRIILFNLFVFLIIIIVKAFSPPETGVFNSFYSNVSLSSDGWKIIRKPWTILTHMFAHQGLWHLGWNMLMLYWFGRITGDLAGDKRILPLYILGGLAGALTFFMYAQVINLTGGMAYGASAAVTCIVIAAAFLAPDYIIRLLILGDVKLKYIALALIIIDIAMISSRDNTGGHLAHLGGAAIGGMFVHMLRRGKDITEPLQRLFDKSPKKTMKRSRTSLTVVENKKKKWVERNKPQRTVDTQERIDQILDKINQSGYESLTDEEKDFLYKVSKQD